MPAGIPSYKVTLTPRTWFAVLALALVVLTAWGAARWGVSRGGQLLSAAASKTTAAIQEVGSQWEGL